MLYAKTTIRALIVQSEKFRNSYLSVSIFNIEEHNYRRNTKLVSPYNYHAHAATAARVTVVFIYCGRPT